MKQKKKTKEIPYFIKTKLKKSAKYYLVLDFCKAVSGKYCLLSRMSQKVYVEQVAKIQGHWWGNMIYLNFCLFTFPYFLAWIIILMMCCVLSHVWLFVTPWTVAARLLCPWDFPGKDTVVGCHALLQGIFLTHRSNLHLLHSRQFLHSSHQGIASISIQCCTVSFNFHNKLIGALWVYCKGFHKFKASE